MATSETYNFSLDNPSVVIEAFDRIGIRGPAITRPKLVSARRSLNLELQEWSVKGLNLWAIDLQTVNLIGGDATYDVDETTINILDTYISIGTSDRVISPMSRSDYAGIPNKTAQGNPTSYWFDRTSPTPTITLWPVPSASDTYVLKYYRMRRLQDADLLLSQGPDAPYRFIDALCAGLAKRLAMKYAKSQYALMKAEAEEVWIIATTEDREVVPVSMAPDLSRYLRG